MLVYTITQLEKYRQQPLKIQQKFDLQNSLKSRDQQIIKVQPVQVQGEIGWENSLIYSHLLVKTELVYPSTRSLMPVNLPISVWVDELYSNDPEVLNNHNDEELIIPLEDQQLDLQKAIEDNILLSIPSQVLTPQEQDQGIMPQGNQWEVVSEEQYYNKQHETVNPQMAKLKELLPKDSQED